MKSIDTVDKKILTELDSNSRINYSAIGKKIRIAKETVKYRIEQLQKKGVIKGFYTLINLSRMGFMVYRLYLRFRNTTPKEEEQIISSIAESQNVSILYKINGPYHLAIGVWVKDFWELNKFIKDLKLNFSPNLISLNLSTIISYNEFTRSYLDNSNSPKIAFTTISKSDPEKLDQTDFKLISFLSNNARASFVEISKKLNLSLVTIRSRLKSLIRRKVILGFRTILDLNKLGLSYYKVDLWLSKFDNEEKIKRAILSNPYVIYYEKSLNTSDLEFDLEVESFDQFLEIIDSIKSQFPEDISDYSYYSLIQNCKTSYAPSSPVHQPKHSL